MQSSGTPPITSGTPHVAAIVNPRSGGGRTGRGWRVISETLERELGPIRAHFTTGGSTPRYLPAADLTRKALKDGAQLVIAVGGDGTINEVVNGFFEDGRLINSEAHLAVLNTGTGGDFRKTFDLPEELEPCVARIAEGTTRTIDIGRMSFIADDGREAMRYFDNIASFGMSGAVDRAVNRAQISKLFGGSFAFLWATLVTAIRFRPQAVRLTADTGFDDIVNIGTAAVANGRFFGGGMMIAPKAEPDSGYFDIVILRHTTLGDLLSGSRALYDGTHLDDPKVTHFRAKWLVATPVAEAPVLLDIDGEAPGRLPARFDILPSVLTLRC
ncbi:diacylglycerol kinase family protein [Parvibaculum sp.]|uniref:diacylglycerol/lipid kinase family protein n=1 Tax=Parvibaculum sp. TaxID=2024848 RepID=UPI002CE35DDD|nr:diacylglycerol kinase family protein [Parvibaculum sp.]HUD52510.1 diacylglycerol kinase family protein [Parvibaculum sp.]